jgi:hypothetical protein
MSERLYNAKSGRQSNHHGRHCTLYDFLACRVLEERVMSAPTLEKLNDEFRTEKAVMRWVYTDSLTTEFITDMAALVLK